MKYNGLKRKSIAALLIAAISLSAVSFARTECFAAAASFRTKVSAEGTESDKITFDDKSLRKLKSRTVKAKNLKINLRAMIKERPDHYSVVQGGCTDGKYAYYLMVSSKTQKGRVLKVRMGSNKVVKRGPVVDVHHGNGMTYDSKRHRLVVIGRESRRLEVVTIDADSLKLKSKKKANYKYAGKWKVGKELGYYGLAAIAYVEKYDCFLSLQRITHDILVLDHNFKVIGFIKTKITAKYPGTYQAMDADEKYVYLLLSPYQFNYRKQPNNIILALDWNSERLLPYVNGSSKKFAKKWSCNNNHSGKPDAVLKLKTSYEAENIYHTTDKKGREHFYLSEYVRDPKYEYVKKDVPGRIKSILIKVKDGFIRKNIQMVETGTERVRTNRRNQQHGYVYDLGII